MMALSRVGREGAELGYEGLCRYREKGASTGTVPAPAPCSLRYPYAVTKQLQLDEMWLVADNASITAKDREGAGM